MIEIDPSNPPQKFIFTSQELFRKLAELPNHQVHYSFAEFAKSMLCKNIRGPMGAEVKGDNIIFTLYQPNDESRKILEKT